MSGIVSPFTSIDAQRSLSTPSSGRRLPPGSIHLGLPTGIIPTLRDFGIDPNFVIREAGLDPLLFENGENAISLAALGRLLTLGVIHTGSPHFGLLVGRRATIQSLGLVGRLMLHSETVSDALRALASNLSVQHRGATSLLTIGGEMVLFTFSVYQSDIRGIDQITDLFFAVTVTALRALCGLEWCPTEVLLPRTIPVDPAPYRHHFRVPVRFNQEVATIVLPVSDLERRIAGADPMVRALLEERIGQMKSSPGSEFSDDIRRLLRTRMASHRCSVKDIADLLAIHRRTLSRHLMGSGMSYRNISNEIRFEIARQLLEDTNVPLGQIAAALGYSEASAFTRAFRRRSGRTPTAWRAEGRPG